MSGKVTGAPLIDPLQESAPPAQSSPLFRRTPSAINASAHGVTGQPDKGSIGPYRLLRGMVHDILE